MTILVFYWCLSVQTNHI